MDKLEIAKLVRKATEFYCIENENEYICASSLQGACGIASFSLAELFKQYGHPAETYEINITKHKGHVYVVSDGEVFDVTATQFSSKHPKVRIERLPHNFYQGRPKQLWEFQKWEQNQRPTRDKIDTIIAYVKRIECEKLSLPN